MANEANRQTGSMLHLCPQKGAKAEIQGFQGFGYSVFIGLVELLKNFTLWNSMSQSNVYNLDAS